MLRTRSPLRGSQSPHTLQATRRSGASPRPWRAPRSSPARVRLSSARGQSRLARPVTHLASMEATCYRYAALGQRGLTRPTRRLLPFGAGIRTSVRIGFRDEALLETCRPTPRVYLEEAASLRASGGGPFGDRSTTHPDHVPTCEHRIEKQRTSGTAASRTVGGPDLSGPVRQSPRARPELALRLRLRLIRGSRRSPVGHVSPG